jgi:syntaxin-binding protein 1
MADQVVRMVDEPEIVPSDRLRLLALYVLFKDGILPGDVQKLLAHAQLPPSDAEVINNMDLLGARVAKALKDKRDPPPPLFPRKAVPPPNAEEYALSRFTPALHDVLEEHVRGTLPQDIFPYTKPQTDAPDPNVMQDNVSAASLRSAKPTWAKSRLTSVEPRQRVIVFMAGGATYSEARSCYEISQKTSRDIFLVSSHMINPGLYLRQLGDLSQDRRRLGLPQDAPKKKAPAHLFEKPEPPRPAAPPAGAKPGLVRPPGMGLPSRPGGGGGVAPPTAGMNAINLNAPRPGGTPSGSGKLGKDDKEKKKKKHHFFSSK